MHAKSAATVKEPAAGLGNVHGAPLERITNAREMTSRMPHTAGSEKKPSCARMSAIHEVTATLVSTVKRSHSGKRESRGAGICPRDFRKRRMRNPGTRKSSGKHSMIFSA